MQMIGLARIGRDAELRYTQQDGTAVTTLSLAYDWGKRGEKITQWVEASLWGKPAEALLDYLKKGRAVVATIDDPHVEEYQRNDGSRGVKLVGRVSSISLAGGSQSDGQAQAPAQAPARAQARTPAPAAAQPVDDDDIPF